MPFRSYEKDKAVQMDVTVEMSLSHGRVERTSYSILDLISDIGGMQGLLISWFSLALAFCNYHQTENFLISRLYMEGASDGQARSMRAERLQDPKECCFYWFFRHCGSQPSRNMSIFRRAREKLARETNMVELIQDIRFAKGAAKLLLSKRKRDKIK